MKKIVGLDSNVFIWGIRGVAAAGQEDRIDNAKRFIARLDEQDTLILLPTPMLAEILSPVPPAEHGVIMALIDKRFLLAPFDLPAATKCAELLNKSYTDAQLVQYRADNAVPKQKMKYDCMIAAICIVRKVAALYSDDNDIEKFSDGQIAVHKLPVIPATLKQNTLFNDLP